MDSPVERMYFELGESRPIQVLQYTYSAGPGQGFNDMHYSLEIGIVHSGAIRRKYGDFSIDLEAGGMWLTGIWEPHSFEILEACKLTVLVLWPPLIARMQYPEIPNLQLLRIFQQPPQERCYRVPARGASCVSRLAETGSTKTPYDALRLRLAVTELLAAVHELCGQKADNTPPAAFTKIAPALNLALTSTRFIDNKEAARACSMSVTSFLLYFKDLMGISFAKFALRQRLQLAAEKLRDPDMPIKQIALECGFTDASHFHHQFKGIYGITPRAYRLKQKS